jgi:hypothetical protein
MSFKGKTGKKINSNTENCIQNGKQWCKIIVCGGGPGWNLNKYNKNSDNLYLKLE